MIDALRRTPKGMIVLLFGLVFGMAWAAGTGAGTPLTAQSTGVTSVSAGSGLTATPNPIVSTGTLAVKWGGTGSATTVSRSDHHHDASYVRQTGGTMSGDLAFTGNRQILAPRIENASAAPAGAAAGRLWFDTTSLRLKAFDGNAWIAMPQFYSGQNAVQQTIAPINAEVDLAAPVTFTLPAEETVIVDGSAFCTITNLINYPLGPLGIQTKAQLSVTATVRFDATRYVTLGTVSSQFWVANTSFSSRTGATGSAILLPAGTYTARVVGRRFGTSNAGEPPASSYTATVKDVWFRIHRP